MADISQLVQKALNGDRAAFDALYAETNKAVCFTCMGFLKNEENARDVMQDVYITAFEKLEALENPEKFGAWIKRIAVNRCKNFLVKKNAHPESSIDDEENLTELVDENFLPEEYVENAEKRKTVMEIVRSVLSDTLYQTVMMFYFDELTITEIAEIMNCPEGTVKYRLNAARTKIKKGVLEYEDKNNEKLHSIVGIPFLTRLLVEEAQTVNVPALDIGGLIPQVSSTVSNTAKPKGGFKGRFIAAAAAVTVVVGGGAAFFIANLNRGGSGLSDSNVNNSDSAFVPYTMVGEYSVPQDGSESEDEFSGEWKIEDLGDGTAKIIGYYGSAEELEVPSVIQGKKIVSVTGFADNKTLKSVKIPEGVVKTELFAFSNCENLSSAELPESMTEMGGYIFCGCKKLTEIDIPKNVKKIGDNAFDGCSGLTSAVIPDGVESVGSLVFQDCGALASVAIPNSVTKIGMGAFSECTSLKSIVFPEKLTEIDKYICGGCTSLESAVIPNGVVSIGESAFNGCEKLVEITIPDSVTKIDRLAFSDCEALKSITLPKKLTELSEGVLSICENLESVAIPSGVTTIGHNAFSGCRNLVSVTIPNSVTFVDRGAFEVCEKLGEVTLPDSVTVIGEDAFERCENIKLNYKGKTYTADNIGALYTHLN